MLYSSVKIATLPPQKPLQGGNLMIIRRDADTCHNSETMQNDGMNSASMICRYFKVAHRDMVFLKFILEAYEGMNVMSTVDNKAGIIRIAIMPGFLADMEGLLADLGRQVMLEPVSWHDEHCAF